jgi:HAMP domain-containing protein
MLQRKFILLLGSLVGLLMVTAVTAIMLLQGVLRDLDALGTQAMEGTTLVLRLGAEVTQLHGELNRRDSSHRPDPAAVAAVIGEIRERAMLLGQLPVLQQHEDGPAACLRLRAVVDELEVITGSWGQSPVAADSRAQALGLLPGLRGAMAMVDRAVHQGLEEQRAMVAWRFRLVALGLGLVFLLLINLSVLAVSRIMTMVLKPVGSLVEASRHLAREDFAHRVQVEGHDEFSELANAYNTLAAQLQANEARKVETMHQVARTLSHEVNNAISIIELQLALLARSTAQQEGASLPGAGDAQRERLSQIRHSLGRISQTVEALTRVRRIVLTDYLAGISMLDLERSTEDEPLPRRSFLREPIR